MKTQKVAEKTLSPIQRKLWNYREEMKLYCAIGDHQKYLEAQRSYMKAYVSNPKAALSLPATNGIRVPLFSKAGLNMLSILFIEIFRLRTDEDLILSHLIKKIRAEKNFDVKM